MFELKYYANKLRNWLVKGCLLVYFSKSSAYLQVWQSHQEINLYKRL